MAKNKLKRVLVIRFSAMGDVAMTVPIVYSLASVHTDTEFVMLSRQFCAPLYANAPENVRFLGINLAQYAGWFGLRRLYAELQNMHFDAVADLHNVLRTNYLCARFRIDGVQVAKINKGRCEKKQLTRPKCKIMHQLPTNFERYAAVFERLGFPFQPKFRSIFAEKLPDLSSITTICGDKSNQIWIGVAPFAKHRSKIYPVALMEQVLEQLSERANVHIFLFGGSQEEAQLLQQWEKRFTNTTACAGKLTLNQELMLMSHLNIMLSMDSANMHLASLVGTQVISIWGATHPFAGFLGWNQVENNCVQIDLPCRPCSVFGNKPCKFGTYACLQQISSEKILKKIDTVLKHSVSTN